MNTKSNEPVDLEDVPEPHVREARRISLIWIVPLVAALIAIGLAIKTISAKGPTITIKFASAEGLEAGKTKIKYKDVEVGRVESIQLDQALAYVKVTASMVPEISSYLTTDTHFWIVRARISVGEISGLGTLFSGAHIAMDPGKKGTKEKHFTGLEKPPIVTMDMPGRYFNLRAAQLGSLDTGAPVYYRQIKVGQVARYQMDIESTALKIQIFIQAPYDGLINQNTRFWNASGFDLTIDPNGVRIDTESIITLLEGGIAFETSANLDQGAPVDDDHVFTLFKSHDKIDEPSYTNKIYFVAYFDGTVRGLTVGAPVEFRGIKVGQVEDFKLEFNADNMSFRIPVLCTLEPDRIQVSGEEVDQPDDEAVFQMMAKLVKKGLRAQLRTGVLLTGQLFVNLSIHPDAEPAELSFAGQYPVLPTLPEPVQEITASLTHLLSQLEKLPIEQIGRDMRETVRHTKNLMGSKDLAAAIVAMNKSLQQVQRFAAGLNEELAPQIGAVLKQTRQAAAAGHKALSAAEKVLSSEAPVTYELRQTLKELAKAARAVSTLAELLERHPQALIYGKGSDQ